MLREVETLMKQTEGTIYVNNPVSNLKSDIRVRINQEKARMTGINTVDIDRTDSDSLSQDLTWVIFQMLKAKTLIFTLQHQKKNGLRWRP